MSIFTNPDELADEHARWLRRHPEVSADAKARLEADVAREARWLRILRQLLFLFYVLPLVIVVLGVVVLTVFAPADSGRWP